MHVVIEGVDCAPDHEGNQYAGEALSEEFTLIFDGKKKESGNHDEQRHADAQERVCPSHGPGPRRVQYGSVWLYVLELAGVDLHDHVNRNNAQEIEAAMPRVDGRSRDFQDMRVPVI